MSAVEKYYEPMQKIHGRVILERENEIIKDIKELEARVIGFEGRITKKVDDLADEFHEFKNDMVGFKSEMSEFKSEMTEFKSEMTEFKSEMTEFKSEMTEFKSEMTEFKADTTIKLDMLIELVKELNNKISKNYNFKI